MSVSTVCHETWSLPPFRIKASRCRSALAMTTHKPNPALGSLDSRCQLVFTHAGLVATSVARTSANNQVVAIDSSIRQVHMEAGESW